MYNRIHAQGAFDPQRAEVSPEGHGKVDARHPACRPCGVQLSEMAPDKNHVAWTRRGRSAIFSVDGPDSPAVASERECAMLPLAALPGRVVRCAALNAGVHSP